MVNVGTNSIRAIEISRQLGEAISETAEYKNFQAKSKCLEKDEELKNLLKTLTEKKQAIGKKLKEGKLIEPDEKKEIQNIETKLKKNKLFKDFAKAQKHYLDLIKKINSAMAKGIKNS